MRDFLMATTAALALLAAVPVGAETANQTGRAAEEVAQRDSADMVRLAQRALQAGGYYLGEIDGVFGPEMLQAVRYYQQSTGIPMTGRLDQRTVADLTAPPAGTMTIGYGSAGGEQTADAR